MGSPEGAYTSRMHYAPLRDALPPMIAAFVHRNEAGAPLRREVHHHVNAVAYRYPDAWFVLGRKDAEAILDLADRVFTTCARVPKGRFPFLGRAPFPAYVAERLDGRAICYHSFYAHISITREHMRIDYAANVARDPVLRWQADLFKTVSRTLRAQAQAIGAGRALRWGPKEAGGLRVLVQGQALIAALRALGSSDIAVLTLEAIRRGGPMSAVQVTRLLSEIVSPPAEEADPAAILPSQESLDLATRAAIRAVVLSAWHGLPDEEKALLLEIARGADYDEIAVRWPELADPVRLTRRITACNNLFIKPIEREFEKLAARTTTPRVLLERIYEVLLSCLPALHIEETR